MGSRLAVGVLAVALLAGATAADASQKPDTVRWRTVEKFGRENVQRYAHNHRKWTNRAGRKVVGRQIVKYGMPKRGKGKRVASRAEWRRTMNVFQRWNNPPPPPAPPPVMSSTAPPATSAYQGGSGSYSIPESIVMCESGGSYSAVNPSSGAYGAYQIMPFHWTSGICSDLGRDPAGQDACAARIWESSGSSAWVCAG
jgi:Transglycosylase-like domain